MRSFAQLLRKACRHRYHFLPKISIIVPFYNSEEYLERCLSNIINATRLPCEIICVDDGSTDNGTKIAKKYRMVYGCVKVIPFERNKGLYYARQVGIMAARGKYIGFVDSDDIISAGYFDLLYESACKENSDIAVGRIINQDIYGKRYLQVRCSDFPYDLKRCDANGSTTDNKSSVADKYWRQEGRCYHFHVVWNKIYRASTLKHAIMITSKYQGHHVMLEDFVYSSIWLSNVHTYVSVPNAKYYYIEKKTEDSFEKAMKNLSDIDDAFDFVKVYLTENSPKYLKHFESWKALYGRIWKKKVESGSFTNDDNCKLLKKIHSVFGDEIGPVSISDDYYYAIKEDYQ